VSGIGTDGHIAFNEPYSSLTSRTRVQALDPETIVANSRFFQNDTNQVPKKVGTKNNKICKTCKNLKYADQLKFEYFKICLYEG
jgi:6-phosphogluconolactonase/glucosamine-6-phosphate isomerase/deaminase